MSVSTGTKDDFTSVWTVTKSDYTDLGDKLMLRPPLIVRIRRNTVAAEERDRKKRAVEELMTLRAIKQDSQPCPRCSVRISRSAGCNHMRCTNCDTHFCYRCGKQIPSDNPYSHFGGGGCPTFDTSEVQRMVQGEREDVGIDYELENLRRQFGRQEGLFANFEAHQNGRPPQRRTRGDGSQCPTCRQFNDRIGRLNHARCHACRSSFCHHCRKKIVGVVNAHYRGEGACPQHEADLPAVAAAPAAA